MKISVSYLSAINNLENVVDNLNNTDCNYLHVDVMDGVFVPNETPSNDAFLSIIKKSKKVKDVHLMVKDIISYVNIYKELKPEYITFHLEATDKIMDVIKYIRSLNIKVGISIKPNTRVEEIIPYLELIDLILVMSVEPGFGGQSFISNSEDKINTLKKLREENDYQYVIEVDGGVNKDTSARCLNADILVVGSYITNSDNYQKQIDEILQ